MTSDGTVKALPSRPFLVGVITSPRDLQTAARLRRPPPFFELRLDHLWPERDKLEKRISILAKRARLIVTARDPREGGANNLSAAQRRALQTRFLPIADYIDVELRSARSCRAILRLARSRAVGCILSFHDFESTPSIRRLQSKARAAKNHGADIFKLATRTDSERDVARLIEFFCSRHLDIAISAMGIGMLGRKSRRQLMKLGSVLVYGSLGENRAVGQPRLSELQRWLRLEFGSGH